jgi:hypothetical protein
MRTHSKVGALLAALTITATMTACSTSDNGEIVKNDDTTATTTTTTPAAEATTEASEPKLGDTYQWDDGLAVTISAPTPLTLSDGMDQIYDLSTGTPLAFDVTVVNGTEKDLDSIGFTSQMLSGSQQAEQIFDTAAGIDMPTVTVSAGNTLTYKIAFLVPDENDIQLSWDALDFDHDQIQFTN